MKVFEKINGKDCEYRDELTRIVNALKERRHSESLTKKYFEAILCADYRQKEWEEGRIECELNECLHLNPQYNEFTLNDGEIQPQEAKMFRCALFEVLEQDKYSFAYIYNLLAQEKNRSYSRKIYDCIFDNEAIDYAIHFDTDELFEKLKSKQDSREMVQLCQLELARSVAHSYTGELKELYENSCHSIIKSYKEDTPSICEATTEDGNRTYTDNLIRLFHNNTDLIDKLIDRSDDEIATYIKKWRNERDKFGKPLIENPDNSLRKDFAEALKKNEIISGAVETFRKKL